MHMAMQPIATQWVIELFALKKAHQADLFNAIGRRRPALRAHLTQTMQEIEALSLNFKSWEKELIAGCRNSLMGTEGSMARLYWQALSRCFTGAYHFKSRSRRPAQDPFNAALNYLYGMLYNVVGQARAGLDTHLGFARRSIWQAHFCV